MATFNEEHRIMVTLPPKVDEKVKNRLFGGSTALGDQTFDAIIRNPSEDKLPVRVHCDIYNHTQEKPKQTLSHTFEISQDSWRRYTYPLGKDDDVVGRAPAVTFSKDLECIRIGYDVFMKSEGDLFKPIRLSDKEIYIEDIDSQGKYLAVARRRLVTKEQLTDPKELEETEAKVDSSETEKPDKTANAPDSPPTPRSLFSQDGDLASTQAASLIHKPTRFKAKTDSDSESSSTESELDSAVEWCSMGDTDVSFELNTSDDPMSSDDSEEALHEDYNEESDIEDLGIKVESDVELSEEEKDVEVKKKSGKKAPRKQLKSKRKKNEDRDEAEVESSGNESLNSDLSDDYDSDDENSDASDDEENEDEDDEDDEDDVSLPDLGGKKRGQNAPTALQIYDSTSSSLAPIFQMTASPRMNIYSSPPVFHPSKPLLVWPMGDNKILFANFQENTYFTCLLGTSTFSSCQAMVRSHFSADGAFLHIASLEASLDENTVTKGRRKIKKAKGLRLNLQVTTHRLSRGKPTKAPPLLVSRENYPMGKVNKLDMTDFPYVLRWTKSNLCVMSRDGEDDIKVAMVPLFPATEEQPSPSVDTAEDFSPTSTLSDQGDAAGSSKAAAAHAKTELDRAAQEMADKAGMKMVKVHEVPVFRNAKPDGKGRPGAGKLRDPAETFIMSDRCNIEKFVV